MAGDDDDDDFLPDEADLPQIPPAGTTDVDINHEIRGYEVNQEHGFLNEIADDPIDRTILQSLGKVDEEGEDFEKLKDFLKESEDNFLKNILGPKLEQEAERRKRGDGDSRKKGGRGS